MAFRKIAVFRPHLKVLNMDIFKLVKFELRKIPFVDNLIFIFKLKSMKSIFVLILCLILVTTACAPLHIREHEASYLDRSSGMIESVKAKHDNGLYYSIKTNLIKGAIQVSTLKNDAFGIYINLEGKKGSRVKVIQKTLKYKYANGNWTEVVGTLSASQIRIAYGKPESENDVRKLHPEFDKDYVYSMENKKENDETLWFDALIPREEQDLEIEIPEIYLGKVLLQPRVLKFQWNDRWTVVPIN